MATKSTSPTGNIHWDGRRIVRCKTLKSVQKALAAGAIAHLISGSVVVDLTASGTLRTFDSSTGTVSRWDSKKPLPISVLQVGGYFISNDEDAQRRTHAGDSRGRTGQSQIA